MTPDFAASAGNPTQERVWAEVDFVSLSHNLREIRLHSRGARLFLVVKANAYGHGVDLIARHALRVGVAGLCVATPTEALELRQLVGESPRILVLGPWLPDEAEAALEHDVELCLHQAADSSVLEKIATRRQHPARVHLNVDTGLGRLGLAVDEAIELGRALCRSKGLEWVGTMTHLASANGPEDSLATEQLARFATFESSVLRGRTLQSLPMPHVESSAALFSRSEPQTQSRYDTVRPGISAYGSLPSGIPGIERLHPVLSLRTRIAALRPIPSGQAVGYGATWRASRPTKLATLPVGYADGLPWRMAGRQGFALVRGQRVPVVGRVSMDMTTLDVTDVPGVCAGDVVTLIGTDGAEQIRCEEIAEKTGTIPYEIFCSLGPRVKRVAVREEEALGALEIPHGLPGSLPASLPSGGQKIPSSSPFSAKRAQSIPPATHGPVGDSGSVEFGVEKGPGGH